MRFDQLPLCPPLLSNVAREGYELATPIQAQAIPHLLEGRDVLGSAQTGTGKTAAFALPIIHLLTAGGTRWGDPRGKGDQPPADANHRNQKSSPKNQKSTRPRCLILCPTRELATQIADSFKAYASGSGLAGVCIFGGVNQNPQVAKLQRGVDVVIATPGRLMDLMNQGHVDLSGIEMFVLDEADRMLDMGFINDIRKIAAYLPDKRQTLLFSATLPGPIVALVRSLQHDPVRIEIAAATPTADRVEQSVYYVDRKGKPELLAELIASHGMFRTIVFTRTKHGADKLVKKLRLHEIKSEAIHGNKTQNARQRALDNFRSDRVPVLVATDVAARGIDVDNVSHVVNYDLTHEPETYVHRIGRTARAGQAGIAISFCDQDEVAWLRDIERLLGRSIAVANQTPDWATRNAAAKSPQRRGERTKPRRGENPRPQARRVRANANPRQGTGASRSNQGGDSPGPKRSTQPRRDRRTGG